MIPLDFLRSLTAEFRPDTCVIQRATETRTSGGTTQDWDPLATVSCRVSRIGQGGTEGLNASGGVQAVGQRRVKLPPGQDITTRDRIVWEGLTLEVVDVQHASNETERTVICREIS